MSLINEALKKAQRQRTVEPALTDSGGPATPVQKRSAPMQAQTLIVLVASAAALIVVSVVITVYLVNRKPAQPIKNPPAVAVVGKATPIDLNAPSPAIVAPVIAPPLPPVPAPVAASQAPIPVAEVATKPAPAARSVAPSESRVTETSASKPSVPTASEPAAAESVALPPPLPVVRHGEPAGHAQPDPRILTFVDNVHVMGIRSSGKESKVLMNDRVYRVNEMVERALGVKLIKVQSDTLTFVDENGVIYTKNF